MRTTRPKGGARPGHDRLIHRLAARRGQQGFTLVELLVVVAIMAILSAVVVFAVQGVGDKGGAAAVAVDERILRTAEEARCAQVGEYADEDILVDEGWLAAPSAIHDVSHTPGTGCGTYTVSCQGGAAPPCAPPAGGGGGGGPTTVPREPCDPVAPATWAPVGGSGFGSLRAVSFLDARRGWIGDDNGAVYRTVNGGCDWSQVGSVGGLVNDLLFANPSTGWAALPGHGVMRTTDGGTTWTPGQFLDAGGNPMTGVSPRAVSMANLQKGYLAGWAGLFVTEDGGATWHFRVQETWSGSGFGGVAAAGPQFAHATAHATGEIWGTRDGGATWIIEKPGPSPVPFARPDAQAVAFPTEQRGYVSGIGRVYATSDGGLTWSEHSGVTSQALKSIAFPTPTTGIAVGLNGAAIRTTDGSTWNSEPGVGTSQHLYDVAYPVPAVAYVVGEGGTLLKARF